MQKNAAKEDKLISLFSVIVISLMVLIAGALVFLLLNVNAVAFSSGRNEAAETPEVQLVFRGKTAEDPEFTDTADRVFLGWFREDAPALPYDFASPVKESFFLMAKWADLGDPADSDGDGLSDSAEAALTTDPFDADSDRDGVADGIEFHVLKTDPLRMDTDGNGIADGDEDNASVGISSFIEILTGTDPFRCDISEETVASAEDEVGYSDMDPDRMNGDTAEEVSSQIDIGHINVFLSNFSEQNAFYSYGFEYSSRNVEEMIDFAFLFCKINRGSEIGADGDYYTISLDSVNRVLARFFNTSLTEVQAAAIPPSALRAYRFFSSGIFYFLAADGESYNRFSIARQVESLSDGTYRVTFDVFAVELEEYWSNGVSDDYYYLTTTEAIDRNLTWCYSGMAILRPCGNSGIQDYHLVSYHVAAEEDPYSAILNENNGTRAAISMNPLVFTYMHTMYGKLKEQYPGIEPQFVNNGRYFVKLPDSGLTLWYQNDNWEADPLDFCQAVTGDLSALTENMQERITLAEFTSLFEPYSPSESYYRYDNSFEIVDSPNTAYYISSVQFAKVYFSGFWEWTNSVGIAEKGGSGGLLEIDLDSAENLGGETVIYNTFFGRVSSLMN